MKGKESFWKKNRDLFLLATCTAVYLLWFFFLENHVVTRYHIIHVGLDDYIPFCEYFIIPYLLWFPYVAAAWLFFYRKERALFRKMSLFLFTGMFVSLFICTIYPNGTDFRPAVDADKNLFCALVSALYGVDTPTNVLPSIHVYNSIGIHIAVCRSEALKDRKGIRAASLVLCILICLATMFLKQHSIVDVLMASFMAYVVWGAVYEPEGTVETAGASRRKPLLGRSGE